ncbi:MAG: SusC/RagA family TonB-linked outer membrane protein [Candidatus Pedobacter colombiensis]|uniref:SusC/RagA family TonB-linked outer membrane protein n=1 Tax=Candidatus Pedobacter colombiensis TaxID=3121371 RepID=A0AAJ5W996_9SPHI|nr:SusC/RagA family TonB-linked outer membrane protein [Pedobacter sp.]WEK19985.1 MAG: SusC/RagA family TonB-linked outer membrane protein [Pedobacter sp.]
MNQTFTKSGYKHRLSKLARLFCLFYLTFICALPVSAFAQAGRFTISGKQISITELFHKMKEQQRDLDFFYSNDEFDASRKVDVNVSNVSLDELMKIVLNTSYSYQLIDNHLVIKPRISGNQLATVKSVSHDITGIVTDKEGSGIPGVLVKAKLEKTTTVTDINGRYAIRVHDEDVLEFSFVGFEKQEQRVKGKSRIDVLLKEDVAFLNEVVVTGYQTLKKKDAPGAIFVLPESEIEQNNNRSLNRLLEGAVPGLVIYKDAKGLDDLRIRGGSSLRAGTQPLLVIDGFVSTLFPDINEISNITVLKDASASAVWGSQAANGVIVITTKKGKAGKLQINYSGNVRIANRPDYNELRRADAASVIDYQKEQYDKGYIGSYLFDGYKTGYSQSIGIISDYDRKDITLAQRDQRLAALASLSNKEQIDNLLLRPAASQSHFMSFSGGSDKMLYFLSGNYQSNLGGAQGNNSDVMTINSRNTFKLASFVDMRTDFSFNYSSGKNGYSDMQSNIRKLLPYQMLEDNQGNYVYDYINFNKTENDRLKGLGYLDNGFNLLEENRQANNTNKGWGLKTRVGADWKIIKGLSLSNDFIYERTTNTIRNRYVETGYDARTLINRLTSVDAITKKLILNIPKGDILDLNTTTYNNYAFRNQLNYINTIKEKHYVNVIAGFDLRKTITEANNGRHLGYNDDLLSFQNVDGKTLAATGIKWWDGSTQKYDPASYDGFKFVDNREYSFYSTFTYTYDTRYNFSASYRTDHSNLFGADPKFKRTPLWSIGGQWNISNEDFFKSNVVSNLGFRATYGLTGNFDRSSLTTTYLVASRFLSTITNDYWARLSTPPNPKLRWERSQTFNLGADLGLLTNRFTMSLDYYRKYSYDLLGNQDLDPTVGLTSAIINSANMINHGVELSLKAGIITTKDFSWISNLNLGYNKNKVTSNKITDSSPAINRPNGTVPFLEGYPRESIWSYKWAGLDNTGRPQVYDGDGNKIYIPNIGSLIYSGTVRPKLSGGWSNIFRYKGFEAMAFLVFNYGHVARREMPRMDVFDWSGAYNNQIAQRWRKPGDELTTDIPTLVDMAFVNESDSYMRSATLSTNSIIDASFVRLREVQFGYNFKPAFLKGTPFKSIRAVAQMNNLYLFKKNKFGIDPEALTGASSTSNIASIYALPEPLTTTIGLNFSL